MCGIAGVVLSGRADDRDLAVPLAAMTAAIHARGPDDRGVYVSPEGRVGLGNTRLAIQDLSQAGHMPMGNAARSVCITYNGEIYNADDLRIELQRLGFTFVSHSDTEVILHGYEAWGESVVQRLRGMFAFALYDLRGTPTLLLARDPLGIKPLYYAHGTQTFAFASECRTVLASGMVSHEIDPTALVTYLQLGSVPAPLTIYREIRALEAGHALRLTCGAGGLQVDQPISYWSLPEKEAAPIGYADAVEQVREVLLDSVRRHLVSDVPLGAFLSGGLDSGSVVALMRRANPSGVIRTCSIVFAEPEYSEAALAHRVAREFDTEHVDVLVTAQDLADELDRVAHALDQPSNDGANTYFVSRAARQAALTVALSGLGGDELFGGYPSFERLGPIVRAARVARAIPGGAALFGLGLRARGPDHPGARAAGWLARDSAGPAAAYLGLRGLFSPDTIRALVKPTVLAESDGTFDLLAALQHGLSSMTPIDTWDAVSRLELTGYMRHQLLRDTDIMSMAHSLEVRVPFVDQQVVEHVLGLPVSVRRGRRPKQLLRDAVPWLPAAVRECYDKRGFSFPFGQWLAGPLRPQLGDLVHTAAAYTGDYLQPGACDRVLDAFDAGRTHWSRPWALAALCAIVP